MNLLDVCEQQIQVGDYVLSEDSLFKVINCPHACVVVEIVNSPYNYRRMLTPTRCLKLTTEQVNILIKNGEYNAT